MPPQPRLAIDRDDPAGDHEPADDATSRSSSAFGYSLFLAFATILIAWQGIRMMLNQRRAG